MLGDEKSREAEFVSAVGYYDGNDIKTFIGKVIGTLTTEVKVPTDNKIDAIFIPHGASKTYSEMTLEEKSTLSHRKKSLEMLKAYLNENNIQFT